MKGIIRIYKADPVFWRVLFTILAVSGMCCAVSSAREIFFRLNTIHTLYLDTFFQNYTLLGDGVFSIAIFLILLLAERTSLAMQVITGYLFSGLISQVLKRVVSAPRPHAIISNAEYPYFIDGITHSGMTSFPSGHTTSIFALATLLVLNTRDRRLSLIYLITAIVTGYSRIYLGQHFLLDVVAGALIGVLSALLVFWYSRKVKIEWVSATNESHLQLQ